MLPNIIGIMSATKDGIIGLNGTLPWHYPEDLKFFEQTTFNKTIIMGRKTYESVPSKIFFDRNALALSYNIHYKSDNALFFYSVKELLSYLLKNKIYVSFMIGGAQIAHLFLQNNLISKFFLTEINRYYRGDTYLNLEYFKNWTKKRMYSNQDYNVYQLINPEYKELDNVY